MWQQTDSSSSSLFYHEQGNRLFDGGGGGGGASLLWDGRQDITLALAAKNNTSIALRHLHYVS